jgi:hypothetical protein
MMGVDLKDQMLQPYLLERKRTTKWYKKLFKRLLNVAVHNAMVIYRCHPNKKNIDTLKFRLSLAQGLVEKHGSGVPRPVYGRPSIEPPPKRLTEHFLERIPATGKKAKPQKRCVVCAKYGTRNLFIGLVNVRQGCVLRVVSRHIIQNSTSNPLASITERQGAHIIR